MRAVFFQIICCVIPNKSIRRKIRERNLKIIKKLMMLFIATMAAMGAWGRLK